MIIHDYVSSNERVGKTYKLESQHLESIERILILAESTTPHPFFCLVAKMCKNTLRKQEIQSGGFGTKNVAYPAYPNAHYKNDLID